MEDILRKIEEERLDEVLEESISSASYLYDQLSPITQHEIDIVLMHIRIELEGLMDEERDNG